MGRVKAKDKEMGKHKRPQVTYSKRKAGILKKAKELSILCDIDIVFFAIQQAHIMPGRPTIEEILAKFAQLTPQERAKRAAVSKDDILSHKAQNSVSSISKATTEGLLPKHDTLPIDGSNESLKDDVVMLLDAKNGDSSLISKAMAEEEEKLQEAIAKEESKRDEAQEPVMNETQFSKLDELLTQTKLYSEFLLEKMEDITFNGMENKKEAIEVKKGGRGKKQHQLRTIISWTSLN